MLRRNFLNSIVRFVLLGGLAAGIFHMAKGKASVKKRSETCSERNCQCRYCPMFHQCGHSDYHPTGIESLKTRSFKETFE